MEIQEIKNYNTTDFNIGYNIEKGGKRSIFDNAQAARNIFEKELRKQKEQELKQRLSIQQRQENNFEKNLKKDIKVFIKNSTKYDTKEKELENIRKRFFRSKLAKEKRINLLKGIDKKSSQYRGVCLDGKKWKASIKYKGQKIHIGMYDNEIDAAKAYNRVAISLLGSKAILNIIL